MPLISGSSARWIAPASFLFNLGCQLYGVFSTPSIKQVHESNLSIFSPQPIFIVTLFLLQQLLQLAWIAQLWRVIKRNRAWKPTITNEMEKIETNAMIGYTPFYALGNICTGVWMFFWCGTHLQTANLFTLINASIHLYYMWFRLPHPMNLSSPPSYLTHAMCKSFAGIGILDALHNTTVAYPELRRMPATTFVRVSTGTAFLAACGTADWIFGACLVYDLLALAAGQYGSWKWTLYAFAAVCGVCVLARNTRRPPYIRREYNELDFETMEQGEYD